MELKQLEAALSRVFARQDSRIVFWNDPEKEFQGVLPHLALDGMTVLRPDEVGSLTAKIRVEREQPTDSA